MQIHELNNFTGTLGSGAYLAIDDGNDTGKISKTQLFAATEARIDNIIAGPAPSAQEVTDARLGADGVVYSSLGDAIRDQFSDVKSTINSIVKETEIYNFTLDNNAIYLGVGYKITDSVASTSRVSTPVIYVPAGNVCKFHASGFSKYGWSRSTDGTTVAVAQSFTPATSHDFQFTGPMYFRVVFAYTDDSSISPSDVSIEYDTTLDKVSGILSDRISELESEVGETFYNLRTLKQANDVALIAKNDNSGFGQLVGVAGYSVSNYIRLTNNVGKIKISVSTIASESGLAGCVFFDKNKSPIANSGHRFVNETAQNKMVEIDVPDNAVYVRTTIRSDTDTYGALACYGYSTNIQNAIYANHFTQQRIFVASSEATDSEKAMADFVCDGVNDEAEINAALNMIGELYIPNKSGTVYLSSGTFYIDSFQTINSKRIAVLLSGDWVSRKRLVGVDRYGASCTKIIVTANALTDLGNDNGTVFGTGGFIYGRMVAFEKLRILLADNQHKVTVIDNSGFSTGYCNDLWISGTLEDVANTENTPMPNEECIGIVGYCGDDGGTLNEMNRVFTCGFYEGFRLGGEHLVCKNLSGRYNYYAYTFGNYNWHIGTQSHPITLINCCDEHSACLPKFVRCGNYNENEQLAKQCVNLIDFNLELAKPANFGAGATAPAEEIITGAWCGKVEYTGYGMSNVEGQTYPIPGTTNNPHIKFWANGSGECFITRNMIHPQRGTSAERGAFTPELMQQYFDTTLNKMLVYNGSAWVDMNGNAIT